MTAASIQPFPDTKLLDNSQDCRAELFRLYGTDTVEINLRQQAVNYWFFVNPCTTSSGRLVPCATCSGDNPIARNFFAVSSLVS